MLVLSRKTQEQIRIGDNITITVLKVQGRSVRIGIEAPQQVRVVRAEIPVFEDQPDETATAVPSTEPLVERVPRLPLPTQIEGDKSTGIRAERPIVIGRRFRVIAPQSGESMLRAIPIS